MNINKDKSTQILTMIKLLIILILILEFPQVDSCSIGCVNCYYDSQKQLDKCQKCDQGFFLNEVTNQCIYQLCDQNLFLQVDPNINNNKCVAICDNQYQPNSSLHVCDKLDQCPHNYITETIYSNSQALKDIVQISSNIFLMKYDGFLNFVNKETGEILYKYVQNNSTISVQFVNGIVISVLSDQTVNIWQIETNEYIQMTKISKGVITNNQSQINMISDEVLCITSFDSQNKIIYFNIFKQKGINNSNQLLTLSNNNQKNYFFSKFIVIHKDTSIKIISINKQVDTQEFYFLDFTLDFICNIPNSSTIVNLIYSIQHSKIVIQILSYEYIFVIDQQSKNCLKINTNQQIKKLSIYYRQNKSDILITQLDSSIIIRSFNDLQNIIGQTNFSYNILDTLLYQTLLKIQFFVLLSSKEVQWIASDNLDDNSNYTLISKVQIKIDSPLQLIPIYNSEKTLISIFAVGFDFQFIDFQEIQKISTKYIVKSFRQTYQANKADTNKIYFDELQSLVYQCSSDGMLTVWNVNTSFRVEYYKEFIFQQDSCRDFVLLKSKIIAVVLLTKIVVFDVTNPNQKQQIAIPESPKNKYSLTCNQEFILIQLDQCLKLIDQSQNIILNKCLPEISSFLYSYISINKNIYSFGATFIKVYQIDLVKSDLIELPQGKNNAQNIQYFYVDESLNNMVLLIYFDSNKNLVILDQNFTVLISTQILTAERIINALPIKDPDNKIRIFILFYSNVPSQSAKYTFHTIKQGETNTALLVTGNQVNGIIKILYYQNYIGELIYKIYASSSLSFTCLIYFFKWNQNQNTITSAEQAAFNRDDTITSTFLYQKYNQIYGGNKSGQIALSPYIINYTEKIYENDSGDQSDIMQIEQSYQINRIFIIKKYIIELDMILNKKIDNIMFDDQGVNSTEDIKQFKINNNLRVVTCFKSFQLILKQYSQKINTYKISNFGIINNYFLHENQAAIYVYGTKLSKYDLTLQNEYIIVPPQSSNKLIDQCIFPSSLIICKNGDFSIIFINNSDFSIFKQLEVTGIESNFLLTMDTQYDYLFLYKKSVLIYTIQGTFISTMSQPTLDIIEFNFYGSKIVIITIAGSYVYQRQSLVYQVYFQSNIGGIIKKSMYLPSLNNVYYISNEIKNGQIYGFSLDYFIELTPIKYTYYPSYQVINLVYENETSLLMYLDSRGTLDLFFITGSSSDTNLTVDEFQQNSPKNFSIDFITNNIIIYNSKLAIQFNLALSTRGLTHYFDPLRAQFIIKSDSLGNKKYIISDTSSILYEYQNYSLVYSSYFDDKIIGIKQSSDQTIVIIYFSDYFLIYKSSSQNQKYMSNNYTFKVTGYRIYKFISDDIFITHDFQLIYYDFTKGSLTKQIDLPKDQTQKCFLFSKEKSLLILGSSNGTIMIYNFSLTLNNKQGITDIFIVKEHFWIVQKDGTLNIYSNNINESSQPESVLSLVSITKNSNQIEGTPIELNIIQVDEQNSRYFVQFNKQKKMSVIDLQTNTLIQHLSFPNNEYNRLKITDKYVVLYSIAQLNVHFRDNLIFAFQIKASNRRDEITELQIIKDSIIIISFLKRLDIYYVPNSTSSALLVDSLTTNYPLVISTDYDKSTTLLSIVGYSVTNLFERKYWLQNFQNQQVACSSVIDGITSIDFLRKLNIIQSASSKKNQLFYINVFDMAPINGIDQTKTQLIIQPQFSLSKSFNINTKTFLLIKKDVFLKNFSFFFEEKGIYSFQHDTEQIFIQDIMIISQNITGIQLYFENKKLVVMNKIKIQSINDINKRVIEQSSDESQSSFLNFENCDVILIYDFQVLSVDIKNINAFVYFSKIKNVIIKNLTIQESSFQLFALFENIQNLTIESVNINKNKAQQLNEINPNQLIVIQGCIQININQMIILDNIDYQILFITNQFEQNNEEIHLKNDNVIIAHFNSTNNKLSSNNLNTNFNQIAIQGTSIQLEFFHLKQNDVNIFIQNSKKLMIKNSNFEQNTNLLGGSIQLKDIKGTCEFINNVFTKNKAFASGGAIYADNIFELKIDSQTQIFENTALIGGGIRIINSDNISIQKELLKNIFDNKAEIYGNNVATVPVDINIYSTQNTSNFIFTKAQTTHSQNENNYYGNLQLYSFQSGSSIKLQINYIDIEGEKIKFSTEKIQKNKYPQLIINEIEYWSIQLESQDVDKIQITGESSINYNQFDSNNQVFQFNDMHINGNPNSQQQLILKFQISNQLIRGEVKIDIQFRPCIQGEIYKQFSNSIYICYECSTGFYSLQVPDVSQKDKNECKQCPSETQVQVCEKNQIKLKQGYWRESNTDNIMQCDERQNSCNELDEKSVNGCIEGYVGPLCNQCDLIGYIWDKRYSLNSSDNECKKCSEILVQYLILFLIAIGLLIYILIQILHFIRNFSSFQTCYYLRLTNMLPISASQLRNQNNFYVKCLINYLQLQSILVNLQIKNIPQNILLLPSFFGQPGNQIFINSLCAISTKTLSIYGQGKTQIIIQTIVPFIYLLIILLVFFVLEKLKLKRVQVKSFYKYTALNFIFIFFQSDSINTLAHFLTCRQIGSKSYISDDLLYECNDPSYVQFQIYYVIPVLIIWILVPLAVYFFLRKRAPILNYCSTIYRFGYYCMEFRESRYYWEFVRIYFKVAIVIFYTFFKEKGIISHMVIIFIMAIYILLLQKMKPFIIPKMMKYEELSYLVLIVNILIFNYQNIYPSKALELLFLAVHAWYILCILMVIAYNKFFTKRSIFGKIFIYLIKKILQKSAFEKMVLKMEVKFSVFIAWKKVRKNIDLLRNQKVIQRITQILPQTEQSPSIYQKKLQDTSFSQAVKNNSNLIPSLLSLQKIIHQNSLTQSTNIKQSENFKSNSSEKIEKNDKKQNLQDILKHYMQQDYVENQTKNSSENDIDINEDENNFNSHTMTQQKMEFQTMDQLGTKRHSRISQLNMTGQLLGQYSNRTENEVLHTPVNISQFD